MSYLHQHRICHGRLKSLNCVLDDRWVCKITGEALPGLFTPSWRIRELPDTVPACPDYGLRTYRRDDGAEPLSTYQQRLLEVYTPPEFHSSNVEPTLAGDVFRYRVPV